MEKAANLLSKTFGYLKLVLRYVMKIVA